MVHKKGFWGLGFRGFRFKLFVGRAYDVIHRYVYDVFMTSYTGFAGFPLLGCVHIRFLYGRSLMCGSAPSSISFCATALWFLAAAWCSGVRPPAV